MKKRVIILALFATITTFVCSAYVQESDNLFTRLQGITNRGTQVFNVDGITITSQKLGVEFSARNCALWFFELKIKENELTTSDSLLSFRNFYVFKSEEECQNIFQNRSYYFVESPDDKLISFVFTSINKNDREFQRNFIELVCNDLIPENIYHSSTTDSVNFAGRKIQFSKNSRWMDINNIQDPGNGQINWSVHKDLDDALSTTEIYYVTTKLKEEVELVSDDFVNVIFEEVETQARKVVYDVTGDIGSIISRSGSTKLIIFYVSVPLRGNFVSCVMSYWESDPVQPSGLPRLLDQVMRLF
jgi:hypothetical protein